MIKHRYCEMCGSLILNPRNRRFCGNQKIKGSCAHKRQLQMVKKITYEKLKNTEYKHLWRSWNLKASKRYYKRNRKAIIDYQIKHRNETRKTAI